MEKIVKKEIVNLNGFNMTNHKYFVFDNMIEGVQVIDHKWCYFYVNNSIIKQGQSTKSELLGHTMMEKYPGIEKTEMFNALKKAMYERITLDVLSEFNFPDGSKGWFELSVQPVPEGILILSSDITKLKKAEAQLNKKLLERTQMLTQITSQKKQLEEFCQIIAHNLRAPLSNLSLLSDMIMQAQTTEEKLQLIEIQNPIIDALHQTFQELVDATQVKMDLTIKRRKINLDKHTATIINLLHEEIMLSKSVISYNFSKINTIHYSKKYIDNILLNLLSNAIKYRSSDRAPEINIRSYEKDGWVCLEIEDNGIGIDLKKNKNDLFKLHKTFHEHPKAKGFGLFIIKTQIEAMGGSINIKSKLNQGSKFTVQLYKMTNDEKN
jgi:signal transduction histidine kinase